MEALLSYLTRSSGIVATVLIVLALAWGLLFSARATGNRRRPNWWLDLHNYLGGLALAFTVLHIAAAYADRLSGIGLAQVFIPMTASAGRWGVSWGLVATYILFATVFTSWPKKRMSRRVWLLIHLLSVPAACLVVAHAWMVGSDRHSLWFHGLLALIAGVSVYPAVLRVASVNAKRQQRRQRSAHLVAHRP